MKTVQLSDDDMVTLEVLKLGLHSLADPFYQKKESASHYTDEQREWFRAYKLVDKILKNAK